MFLHLLSKTIGFRSDWAHDVEKSNSPGSYNFSNLLFCPFGWSPFILRGSIKATYTATASGQYTVRVTNTNGCTSTSSALVVITVNPLPPAPVISPGGPTTFCQDGSVTLASSSSAGNQWYKDGTLISDSTRSTYTATVSGEYTAKVVNTSGCSTTSLKITITVNPLPPKPTTIRNNGRTNIQCSSR